MGISDPARPRAYLDKSFITAKKVSRKMCSEKLSRQVSLADFYALSFRHQRAAGQSRSGIVSALSARSKTCWIHSDTGTSLLPTDVTQILFYNKFIIFLYMFRALLSSSTGGQNCIIQHLVSSRSVGGRPVRRSSLNLRTGRPPTQCDDTRCCIIQF